MQHRAAAAQAEALLTRGLHTRSPGVMAVQARLVGVVAVEVVRLHQTEPAKMAVHLSELPAVLPLAEVVQEVYRQLPEATATQEMSPAVLAALVPTAQPAVPEDLPPASPEVPVQTVPVAEVAGLVLKQVETPAAAPVATELNGTATVQAVAEVAHAVELLWHREGREVYTEAVAVEVMKTLTPAARARKA